MPFREQFTCLWCGAAWQTRGPDDLEGWAQLCPTCLGTAGENPFRRARLRTALAERAADRRAEETGAGRQEDQRLIPARRAFPDDWYLRRGDFERGALHDTAWAAELDAATRWVDERLASPPIAEPAAGVGFWSPLLASRGELWAWDTDGEALDRARDRLLAHRLRAHLHVGQPFEGVEGAPDGFGAILAAFLAGRWRADMLDRRIDELAAHLAADGRLLLVELLDDAMGGPPAGTWTFHDRAAVETALAAAGLHDVRMTATGRFLLLAEAVRSR